MRDPGNVSIVCEDVPEIDALRCHVTVGDDSGATHHQVRVTFADMQRYAPGAGDPVRLVRASFEYLLEREPRESILRDFDLPDIERYFPSFRRDLLDLLL